MKGIENLDAAGERVVIAPNHVSLLDGPLLHTLLPKDVSFAVNSQIATAWRVKPFLKVINAYLLEPTRPLAARTLVNAVKGGETIVIFAEGRITVTGGLMKVYDGTAMIADKADAAILPVRIDGPERSPFSYLKPSQIRKALFPKFTVTFLPPRRLVLDPALKGKLRRQAAGLALQDIMVEAAVATAPVDRTLFEALADAHRTRDIGRPAVADPLGIELSYRKLILAAQVLGPKLAPYAAPGGAVGVMLPNSVGVTVTFFALQAIGRVPAMINFTAGAPNIKASCRAADVSVILTSRTFVERGRLHALIGHLEQAVRIVYLEDVRLEIGLRDKLKEGYGVTETAPVLAMNTPIANRPGTVGRLSPLMQARLEPVAGVPEGGRLIVKGPNVMLGYYRGENPGVLETLPDGWYDTGDIVTIDAQGFIKIQGRVKRFAKIAGEMISLAAVEALAAQAVPGKEFAVVAVPDARKGEHTVLLTTDASLTREMFSRYARAKGAPELMVPSEIMVVDKLPVLGSGKADYVAAAALARAKAESKDAKSTVAA